MKYILSLASKVEGNVLI